MPNSLAPKLVAEFIGALSRPFRWRPTTNKTSTRPDSVAGLRGLEPADVISTMFITANGRKVSGPTIGWGIT
jgi:hypothetical protein